MKRILLFVLAIVIAASCFAVPAFASEVNTEIIPVTPLTEESHFAVPTLAAGVNSVARAVIPPTDESHIGYYGFTKLFGDFVGNGDVLRGDFNQSLIYPYNIMRYNTVPHTAVAQWNGFTKNLGTFDEADYFYIEIFPLGISSGFENTLWLMDLSTFPVGCSIFLTDLSYSFGAPYSTPYEGFVIDYYDSQLNHLDSTFFTASDPGGVSSGASIGGELKRGGEYAYARINLRISNLNFFADTNYTWNLNRLSFSVTFPPQDNSGILYDILGATNGTNELIEKLLGIWQDDVNPVYPDGTGDFNTDVDSVIDSAQGGIDYAGGLLDSLGGSLQAAATGFAALTAVFNLFAVMPFFSLLLQLSVTIGLFGLMTGLLGSIVSKFSVRGKGD